MASAQQVQELVEKMTFERDRFIAQVVQISESDAERMPVDKAGEEQWTVKEQLAHLCEMELSYDTWVRAALEQDAPEVSGLTSPPVAIPIERANQHTIVELVEVMKREREETLS